MWCSELHLGTYLVKIEHLFTKCNISVSENISTEWVKLRFQCLALTNEVIHLLETLRYVGYILLLVTCYEEIFTTRDIITILTNISPWCNFMIFIICK